MARLIDGEWVSEADQIELEDGEFDRVESTFRETIASGGRYPPEAGRYHLYISFACPWSHRTHLTASLNGLEDALTIDVVDPVRENEGWEFSPDRAGCTTDRVFDSDYLREVYVESDPDVTGRPTVPVLFDTHERTIVNNESSEIMRMLDTEFDDLATRDVNLYPEGDRDEVDRVLDRIYDPITHGVSKAGYAETQEAYESAVTALFDELSHWDDVLAEQRYLVGEQLTEADLSLFVTLYRFDEAYHTGFKCNYRRITEFPNLWGWVRELYQLPGVAETCDMEHVKANAYRSHGRNNPNRIVPIGPDPDFTRPHERDDLPGGPPADLVPGSS